MALISYTRCTAARAGHHVINSRSEDNGEFRCLPFPSHHLRYTGKDAHPLLLQSYCGTPQDIESPMKRNCSDAAFFHSMGHLRLAPWTFLVRTLQMQHGSWGLHHWTWQLPYRANQRVTPHNPISLNSRVILIRQILYMLEFHTTWTQHYNLKVSISYIIIVGGMVYLFCGRGLCFSVTHVLHIGKDALKRKGSWQIFGHNDQMKEATKTNLKCISE